MNFWRKYIGGFRADMKIVNEALVDLILERANRKNSRYNCIRRLDGADGELFDLVLRRCFAQYVVCAIARNVREIIWSLRMECICLLCNIVGEALIMPMCGDVVDLLISVGRDESPRDYCELAQKFIDAMNGFTVTISSDVTVSARNKLRISRGTYDVSTLITILFVAKHRADGRNNVGLRKFFALVSRNRDEMLYLHDVFVRYMRMVYECE